MRTMFNRLLIYQSGGNGRLQERFVCSLLKLRHRDATNANLQCFPPPHHSRRAIDFGIVCIIRISWRLVCDAGQYNERLDFCFTGRDSSGKSMRSIVIRTSLFRTCGAGGTYQQQESQHVCPLRFLARRHVVLFSETSTHQMIDSQ